MEFLKMTDCLAYDVYPNVFKNAPILEHHFSHIRYSARTIRPIWSGFTSTCQLYYLNYLRKCKPFHYGKNYLA